MARLVAATLLLTTACADRQADTPESGVGAARPDSGGVAVVAEIADIVRPMPLVDESSFDAEMVDILYMGVTRGAWREGRLVPLLAGENPMAMAERWSWANPDSTALRFTLRGGLRWSDGAPITPGDVAWSYAMVKDTVVASPRQENASLVDSVTADGDSAVIFHFARRAPEMWTQTMLPIAPRHVYAAVKPAELRTHPAFSDPSRLVVSGPFRVARWRAGERLDLVRNPHFPVRARLDGIVFRILPEPTTRLAEMETGRADLARPVAAEEAASLRGRMPGVSFLRETGKNWDFVAFNPEKVPAFRDLEVRRALGHALDVPEIIRALRMESFAVQAGGPYGPVFGPLHDSAAVPPLRYDTAAARRILESRGWRDADGDGIRERDGAPLRFTLLTNAGNARRRDLAQLVQRYWRAVGADVSVSQLETNTFNESLMGRTFEAAVGGWAVSLDPELAPLFSAESPLNFVGFRDPEVDRLWEQARAQPTAERAAPLWRAAAERIAAARPYTWLYFYDGLSAASDRLRGMRVDTYGAYQNTWEWWIPADRRLPRDRTEP